MRLARGIGVGVLALGLSGYTFAQDSARTLERFVGNWKEDLSKSVVPPTFRNPLRFAVNSRCPSNALLCRLTPIEDTFGPRLSPMSPE